MSRSFLPLSCIHTYDEWLVETDCCRGRVPDGTRAKPRMLSNDSVAISPSLQSCSPTRGHPLDKLPLTKGSEPCHEAGRLRGGERARAGARRPLRTGIGKAVAACELGTGGGRRTPRGQKGPTSLTKQGGRRRAIQNEKERRGNK